MEKRNKALEKKYEFILLLYCVFGLVVFSLLLVFVNPVDMTLLKNIIMIIPLYAVIGGMYHTGQKLYHEKSKDYRYKKILIVPKHAEVSIKY